MSNFAAQISSLVVSGSRLTDGTANASGKVWLFQPGTNTEVDAYADADAATIVSQPIVLGAGGRLPSDLSNGLFVTQPVRLYIEDASGVVVSDTVFVPASAGDVGVDNSGFTDATLDDVLTKAFASTGGQDWKYKESGGATERTIAAKFREISVSVKDFGAVGNNVAIDTTAIQAAVSRVKALGGGIVYFPPGTYKIDQAITLSSATGVQLVGAGTGTSIISQSAAATNCFTVATVTDFAIKNLACSAGAIVVSDATTPVFDFVKVSGATYGIDLGGTTNTDTRITNCNLTGTTRALRMTNCVRAYMTGTQLNNVAGTALEYAGSTGFVKQFGNIYAATTGVLFNSALTGLHFVIAGCPSLGNNTTTSIDMTGLAALPDLRQWGNNVDASATSSAGGATQTPILYRGSEVILTAASGAGAVTVAPPAILPGTSATDVGLYWDFVFKNVIATTWTTDAIYVLDGAVAIPGTIAHTIMVRFRWDRTTSKLRECSRSDTVT